LTELLSVTVQAEFESEKQLFTEYKEIYSSEFSPHSVTLEVTSLGKQYTEDTWGVRDVTASFDAGVHGLMGPNGAGKSTLMRLLTTVAEPTEGEISWDGTDVRGDPGVVRERLGYLPQDFETYPSLSLEEFLQYVAALRGIDRETASARIDELLELVNLAHVRDRRLGTFSGGMHQRAGIAQALLNDPELLIVDEPTVGLDPEERVRIRTALSNTAGDRVVLLSTHIVPDVESTASEVAVLDDGRLVTHETSDALIDRVAGRVYECTISRGELSELEREHQVCSTVERSEGVDVRLVVSERATPPEGSTSVPATLEDAYLDLIDSHDRV
jgi:ABC-type multidrug transport system ATPase subunit